MLAPVSAPRFDFVGPRDRAPWLKLDFDRPAQIPTMITREEARYLRWLTRTLWDDSGHVVEMGPWLGGSTYCLASGMADHVGEKRHRLHVFDSFEWREFMASRAPLQLAVGASFEPHFRANLQSFGDLVESHRAVLPDELLDTDPSLSGYRNAAAEQPRLSWSGAPVQLLFIDGAKSWTGMLHLLRETAPGWLPGKTLVICQDYKHWGCYWVTAITELLSHRLRLLHVIPRNTVAFVVESCPTPEELAALPDFTELRLDATLELLESAAARLDDVGDRAGAGIVRLGKVPLLVHRGESARAEAEFRRQERRFFWPAFERQLIEARALLSERLGRPLAEGRRHHLSRSAISLAARVRRQVRARLPFGLSGA